MAKKRSKQTFAENLRRVLSKADLRKAEFSARESEYLRKLTYTGISHYRGSETIRKLCDFLEITIESLWDTSDPDIARNVGWRERERERRERQKRLREAPKQIAIDLFERASYEHDDPRDAFEDFVWRLRGEFAVLLGDLRPIPFYDNPLYPILVAAVKREMGGGAYEDRTRSIREIAAEINRPLDHLSLWTRVRRNRGRLAGI